MNDGVENKLTEYRFFPQSTHPLFYFDCSNIRFRRESGGVFSVSGVFPRETVAKHIQFVTKTRLIPFLRQIR